MSGRRHMHMLAAMVVLAVLGMSACGEGEDIPWHPPPSSPCSAFRDDAWSPNTDVVAWHPSGTEIFFSIGAPNAGVYAIAPEGSGLSQIARSGRLAATENESFQLARDPVGPAPSFSVSSGGSILVYATCAYLSRPEEQWPGHYDYLPELVQVQTTGAHDFRLTENAAIDDYPTWSPDGAQIAFLSDRAIADEDGCTSGLDLFTMAWDGSDIRCLAMQAELVAVEPTESTVGYKIVFNLPRHAYITPVRESPRWSPDGKRIAIAVHEDVSITGEWDSPRENRFAIYSVGSDGTGWQRLTDARSGPSWSPDGQRLAFARPDGDEMALYTIAADGAHTRRVTIIPREHWIPRSGEPDLSKAWIETVAWSPDGSKILYTCGGICVVKLDGTPTSDQPLRGDTAAWSPDGSRIATVSTAPHDPSRGLSDVLRTMAPDGSDLRTLVVRDKGGNLQTEDDLRRAVIAARQAEIAARQAACAAATAVPKPETNPDLVRDCETLLQVRDALRGTAELNWTPNRPIGKWVGLHVGGWPRRLIAISLNGRGLAGKIPPELGELTHLRRLELSGNMLGGEIPPELGQLTQLARLELSANSLSGEIPRELGALTRLVALDLRNNQLTGSILPEFGQLTNLEMLFLGGNQLTGCIPPTLHSVPRNDLDALKLSTCASS